MDAPLNLADIRREIDALDASLRALLLKRADLVAQVAASKAQSDDDVVLRPEREAAQMDALLDWQQAEAPHLNKAGVVAIWREIISMAIAQQGGLTICATAEAMAAARAYFGASLTYIEAADAAAVLAAAQGKNHVGVLTLNQAQAPLDGQGVFARLPVGDAPHALCYGPLALLPETEISLLVWRGAAQKGDKVLAAMHGGVLVETDTAGDDALWGQYRALPELGDGQ